MIHNDTLPRIEVDAETYEVRADGELLTCEPAPALPLFVLRTWRGEHQAQKFLAQDLGQL